MHGFNINVYIDKLDDIVNKYNNTYHSTIKMKPVDVKLTLVEKLIINILNPKILKTLCKKLCSKMVWRRFCD